jgi:glutamate 5-kinase
MTSTEGIYREAGRPETLVRDVIGKSYEDVERQVRELQKGCVGASRAGANGARAKLEYALGCVRGGTTVIIGHARHHLSDLTEGRVPCTRIGVEA